MKLVEVVILSTICSAITGVGILTLWQYDVEAYDFWKNLMLVIIPVLITVYGSKTIVNSWQIQKDKAELRKKLLSEFDEGFSNLGQFMFDLFYKIRYSYVKQSKIKLGMDDENIEDIIDFPADVNEQPLARFGNEINNLLKAFSKSNTAQTKFYSSLYLYFDNTSEIIEDCAISNTFGKDLNILLHEIINATNKSDFINACSLYNGINTQQMQKNNFVRIMLVYEKIKNPEKGMNQDFIEGFKVHPTPKESSSSENNTPQDSEPKS